MKVRPVIVSVASTIAIFGGVVWANAHSSTSAQPPGATIISHRGPAASLSLAVRRFKVSGLSMEPTLRDGEQLLVLRDGLTRSAPKRGDIEVFMSPSKMPYLDYVKRVIGIPGDRVQVRSGHVYVNGKAINEPYVKQPANYSYGPKTVPAGHYFLFGDNRNNSFDSHIWGMLPGRKIVGQVFLTYDPAKDHFIAQQLSASRAATALAAH